MPLIIHNHYYGTDEAKLNQIIKLLKELKMNDQELKDLLTDIGASTDQIGENLGVVATAQETEVAVVQNISDDIDRLITEHQISDEAASTLQSIQTRLKVSSAKSALINQVIQDQVPVLRAIAAKGEPVSAPPPAPPTL